MTIQAYQTLYESSVAFGMRKALMAEQGKSDMEQLIKNLEAEKKDLEKQVNINKHHLYYNILTITGNGVESKM